MATSPEVVAYVQIGANIALFQNVGFRLSWQDLGLKVEVWGLRGFCGFGALG